MQTISRRKLVKTIGILSAGLMLSPKLRAFAPGGRPYKAIAFDAFPIFDPRPVFKAVTDLFPERGKELTDIWQTKLFAYQWLRAAGGQYKSFPEVAKDALDFAATKTGLQLSAADEQAILGAYGSIKMWPDVLPVLQALKKEGYILCFLSNMTLHMLQQGLQNSKAEDLFDHIISTDTHKTYKPAPAAYQMAIDVLHLRKEEILFVPFAGWDMAGAKWFGYPTFWVNRLSSPPEDLHAVPDGAGTSLNDLLQFVKG